jgi:D-alanine-D-alanine ligase
MATIGFAFNLKPDAERAPAVSDEPDAAEEEPPSPSRGTVNGTAPSVSRAQLLAESDEFAEWDSEETISAVEHALSALGDVVRLEATAEFPERLRRSAPDIVFNMAEGLRGPNREGHIPAICEFYGVPYSGSDPFTLSLCLDKRRTKETLAYHEIPTAPFAVVERPEDIAALVAAVRGGTRFGRALLGLPLFVKPVHEGSSKGITERNFCETLDDLETRTQELLEQYAQPVLVEEYLPGLEFTCAVLGNGATARVLPIIAMRFDALPPGARPIYGFEAKWLWDGPEHQLELYDCPARIDSALERHIVRVTLDAYHALGCRDWSRIDVRLDAAGIPNVVEANPLPGVLPDPKDNSCMPKAARAAGMSYDELVQSCVRAAAERQGVVLDSGIGNREVGIGNSKAATAHNDYRRPTIC